MSQHGDTGNCICAKVSRVQPSAKARTLRDSAGVGRNLGGVAQEIVEENSRVNAGRVGVQGRVGAEVGGWRRAKVAG